MYRKYNRRYGRYKPRRRYRKKNYNKGALALKKVNKLAKDLRPEMKSADDSQASVNIFTTPEINLLGPGNPGDEVLYKSVQIKGLLQVDNDEPGLTHYARLVLVLDKNNPIGTAEPVFGDIFQSTSIFTLRNREDGGGQGKRFSILWDRTYKLSKDADGTTNEKQMFSMYKKLNLRNKVDESSSVGTQNSLYFIIWSTSATGVMDCSYESRVRFQDVSA